MEEIDKQAKYDGSIEPMLWWRYRDDNFEIWIQGLEKLLEFTEYISSLYPTIEFQLLYFANSLNVLDLTLRLIDRTIYTHVYFEPTDQSLVFIIFQFPPTAMIKGHPVWGYFKSNNELLRKYLKRKVWRI